MTENIAQIVSQGGVAGVLCLLAWWGISKGLPGLVKQFSDSLQRQREDFLSALETHKEFFASQLERDREVYQEGIQALKQLNTTMINCNSRPPGKAWDDDRRDK